MSDPASDPADTSAYRTALLVYLLHLAALGVGFTLLIGGAVNWLRWDAVRGTRFETHFAWQWDTFIKALVISAVAVVLIAIGQTAIALFEVLGLGLLLGGIIWFMYRTVTGLLALTQRREPGDVAPPED